jgi:thiol-disulfide isomerase/thioredoxin
MNKKILGIIVVIVLAAGGAIAFSALNKGEMLSQTPTTSGNTETSETPAPAAAAQAGAYIDYYDGVISKTVGTKVLFFHAPWCPQCRALEASIKKDGVPSGVTIIKVDYDTNQKLRQRYGVTIQTTLIKIDDNGEPVKSYVAYNEPSIESVKRNLL